MIFADDIVGLLCRNRREEIEKETRRVEKRCRRQVTENYVRGSHRNLDGKSDINLPWYNLEIVTTCKYLGSTFAENGGLDAKMTHTIQSGWEQLEEGIGGSV